MEAKEVARLIARAKALKKKMEAGTLPHSQLCELYGIYSILMRIHLAA